MDERYQGPPLAEDEVKLPELSEADAEALEYYLAGGARKEKRGYQGEERRSVKSLIDREIHVLLNMKMKTSRTGQADRMIDYFQDYAPVSIQEGMSLLEGPARRIENASLTKVGEPEKAVIRSYNTYAGYLLDADHDINILNQAVAESEEPDLDFLRNSTEAQEIITKELMARDFLWQKFYPEHGKPKRIERHKFWKGYTLAVLRFASDESAVHLYEFARKRADRRFRDWMGQMEQIEANPMVKQLEEEEKIISLTFTRLWAKKARQLELQTEEAGPPQPEPRGETDLESLLPEAGRQAIREQRRLLELEQEELDREMEKLEQRMSSAEAREELKKRGYGRVLLGETLRDEEDRVELEDISERAGQQKPRRTKRGKGGARRFPSLSPWVRKQPGYDKKPPQDTLF